MRKTLVLTHEYYPFTGGVARYCYNLFKNFPPAAYLVVSDHPSVVSQGNILHLNLKNKFIRPTWLLSWFKLRQIIKANQIEQIFTPNILPLGSMAYLFWKIEKIPYVISLHGLDISTALKNKPSQTKMILANAKKIIVNSKYTADLLSSLKLDDKIEIIYPSLATGSSVNVDPARIRQKYHLASTDKILLTVGRLNHRKGHDLVLRALAKLNRADLKYLIVGQGEEENKLRQLTADLKLEEQVIFAGAVSDHELAGIYELADIFVMPNREKGNDVEGFGMVFLEAARLGLAIIAGQSGGVTEILTDNENALLVASDDASGLFTALSKLVSDVKLAKDLGVKAQARVQAFASSQKQSEKLAKILN